MAESRALEEGHVSAPATFGKGASTRFRLHSSMRTPSKSLPFTTRLAASLFVEVQGTQIKMLYGRAVVSCVCAFSVTGRPDAVLPGRRLRVPRTVPVGHRPAAARVDAFDLPGLEAPATGCRAGPPRARAPTRVTGP